MYKISQIVSCGTTGLCRISALTERSVDGKPVQYYQLDPLRSSGTTAAPDRRSRLEGRGTPALRRIFLCARRGAP